MPRKLQLLIQDEGLGMHSTEQRCRQRLSWCPAAHRALTRRLPGCSQPQRLQGTRSSHPGTPSPELFSVGFTGQTYSQSQGEKNNVLEALKHWAWLFKDEYSAEKLLIVFCGSFTETEKEKKLM